MTATHTIPKILIVLHQENSSSGRVGQELRRRGFQLDIRKPRFGDCLPTTLEHHAGAVVFGGPMSANDHDAFITKETDWLAVPLKENKPLLGICLGAQMLARHLGAKVAPRPDGEVEIGYYPITPTAEGKQLMKWPEKVYQWHNEGFTIPSGATRLAGSERFPNQAMQVNDNTFGIQFHPELTHAMMNRWTTKGSARLKDPGAQTRRDHFAGRFVFDPALFKWLQDFMDLWIGHANGTNQVVQHPHLQPITS
ncbi:glutamine amidotransferase [Polycladidibacter stylochi]|uniref:glutamine amidotransferase n=1 Tax=Polycladidibacter stylochi TaxID=1807766 RepID=UPI00082B9152|nr:glutamine amidotransferase [Pseudovibrio stylochi]